MILGKRCGRQPAYNAERTIEKTWREVIAQEIVDLVIVVDDASRDATVARARMLDKVVVHTHPSNHGYGANQKTCYRIALEHAADIVIMIHPDYQYTPKFLPAMAGLVASGLYPLCWPRGFLVVSDEAACHGGGTCRIADSLDRQPVARHQGVGSYRLTATHADFWSVCPRTELRRLCSTIRSLQRRSGWLHDRRGLGPTSYHPTLLRSISDGVRQRGLRLGTYPLPPGQVGTRAQRRFSAEACKSQEADKRFPASAGNRRSASAAA